MKEVEMVKALHVTILFRYILTLFDEGDDVHAKRHYHFR